MSTFSPDKASELREEFSRGRGTGVEYPDMVAVESPILDAGHPVSYPTILRLYTTHETYTLGTSLVPWRGWGQYRQSSSHRSPALRAKSALTYATHLVSVANAHYEGLCSPFLDPAQDSRFPLDETVITKNLSGV